jgi:hypothetical protein
MTTVLLADRDGSALGPLGVRTIPALLPLQAVPVFERMLEAMVAAGIRSALVVTGPRAEEVERRFGKGIRWGIALEYVRKEGEESAVDVLKRVEHRLDGETLVFRADVGIHPAVGEFVSRTEGHDSAVVAALANGRLAGMWRIRAGSLKKADLPGEPSSPDWVKRRDHDGLELEGPCRLIDSIAAYREIDGGDAPAISPRAVVHPGAKLEAGTTVAEETVVCSGARLRNVSVLPRTVIPAGVSLEDAVVSGNLVVRTPGGEASLLTDLLPPAGPGAARRPSVLDRLSGIAALVLSLPLWPVAFAWAFVANAGHAVRRVTWNLCGPGTSPDGRPARLAKATFQFETAVPVLRDLPLVLALASGALALTGVAPLSASDEDALPGGWESARRDGPVGLLAPSRLLVPPAAPGEVPALVDAFEARRPTPGLLRLALAGLVGRAGWVAPKAFNPDELEETESR